MIWHISIELAGAGPAPTIEELDELLRALGPEASVIGTADEPLDKLSRYGADFTVMTEDPASAVASAFNALTEAAAKVGLPGWPLARLEVKSDDELDLELSRPSFPQFVGVTEVARLLGVTRQRASILAQGAEFPAPVAVLAAGPVWTLPSVRRFTEAWVRRVGRPKKAAGGGASLAAARPRIASAAARPAPVKAAAKVAPAGTRRSKKAAPPER